MVAYFLVFDGGDRDGERVALSGDRFTIGRAADNDLVIQDSTVSSHHAALTIADDGVLLEDLGSTNGTFHRSKRVDRIDLEHGVEFQLGKVRLHLEDDRQLAAARTRGVETQARRRKAAGTREGMSEELKALSIGLLGAVLVVAIGFLVLSSSRSKRREPILDEENLVAGIQTETLLGEDRGFEVDARSPAASWEKLQFISGTVDRSQSGASEGRQCLALAIAGGFGERYLPSVGVRFHINRLPFLPTGGALAFEASAALEGSADAALWTRLLVDDDPSSPCTILRGSLASRAEPDPNASAYRRMSIRLPAALHEVDESPYEIGLLAWSRGRDRVRFDDVAAERVTMDASGPSVDRFLMGEHGRFAFYWSGVGSAYVCRWTNQGRIRRQAFLRDLLFIPPESARPIWMDPNFAPLMAAGLEGRILVPGVYLDRATGADASVGWVLRQGGEGAASHMVLELEKNGAGPLPPISFTLDESLLAGSEEEAVTLFGGDEVVANWLLDEDAAAARHGQAYPEVSPRDEEIEGVRGIAFGPHEPHATLRSVLRFDRSMSVRTRRGRGGLAVTLRADVNDGEKLVVQLGPVDLPTHLELKNRRIEAEAAAKSGEMGQAVRLYRAVLDRAPLIRNEGAKKVRSNVRTDLDLYRPLEVELRTALKEAVEQFDAERRRAEQALALGSPAEIREMLEGIGDAESGLTKRYQGSAFEEPLAEIQKKLQDALNAPAPPGDVFDEGRARRAMKLQLAEELDQARSLRGESGPSPLAAFLREERQ